MTQEKFCSDCSNSHDCKSAYEQIGKADGPSIVFKAVTAFLIPIVVFIVSLAILQNVLAGRLDNASLQTAMEFFLALGIAFLCVLIIKAVNSHLSKVSDSCESEGDIKSKPKVK